MTALVSCWGRGLAAGLVMLMGALQPVHAVEVNEQRLARGAYLARAGNCQTCHSIPGGAAYSGGRGIETPFGTVYAGNLSPDVKTGLGSWNSDDFWQAMHHGRSRDGRLLYPAFPYPQFTILTRSDADDIYYFLRSLPPVAQANTPHALRFPYGTQTALRLWRTLYFSPAQHQNDPAKPEAWNRGSYLVNGLGHCAACHSPRDRFGSISEGMKFQGGLLPDRKWYAPSLLSIQESSVAKWANADVIDLLQTGVSSAGRASGPMSAVVFDSTQHLNGSDLAAMAIYLKDLPQSKVVLREVLPASPQVMQRGSGVYEKRCASCHGKQGQGRAAAYPVLAGNRIVTMHQSVNLIRVVEQGGFAPVTSRHPRPYGMPPFGQTLTQREFVDVLTFIRQSWGNSAPEISELEFMQAR